MLDSNREELFACFGHHANTPDGPLFLVRDVVRAPESEVERSVAGLKWSPQLTRQWTLRAERDGMGVIVMHAHHGAGRVELSNADRATQSRLLTHFASHLPENLCGYVVIGNTSVAGELSLDNKHYQLGEFRVVTTPLGRWGRAAVSEVAVRPAMVRQVSAITEKGQRTLNASSVGLIGVGGGGSNVSDQLSHMDIGRLLLCDEDLVEAPNLSRQTGAGPSDVGSLKIEVMAQVIHHANPNVRIELIAEAFPGPQSWFRMRNVDVLVACVDSALARHEINKFARRFLLPLVSIGATIRHDNQTLTAIAGYMARTMPDGACLECEGLTTPLLREREARQKALKYGVGGEPQVMSVNGVLASLATTEVIRLISGFAEDQGSRHWRYDALRGEVYPRAPIPAGCDVCHLSGMGTASLGIV
jgi:molybdopterin/thiamine biosynthesis adenylyltransferase